ncbi:MAG: RIP metalloprotease RseP [Firmicutes bacterium]|nr:RIP metalloprotease RseP [Bacillota bacterium]
MDFLIAVGNILLFLIVLSVVICIHELGHFFFAKKAGVLCHEFSFGMGPKIWSKKKGETTFSIRAIPFGGFVSMSGEEVQAEVVKVGQKIRLGFAKDGEINRIIINPAHLDYQDYLEVTIDSIDLQGRDQTRLYINEYTVKRDAYFVFDKNQMQIAPYDRNFSTKTKIQRFLITFGGPMMNFILAFFVYLFIALTLGVANTSSTVVGDVSSGMPASEILLPGDIILSINDEEVSAWTSSDESLITINSELAKYLTYDSFVFEVERDGEILTLEPIIPQYIFYALGFTSSVDTTDLIIGSPLYVSSELLAGDKILSINGEIFANWNEIITYAIAYTEGSTEENPTTITVERDGVEYTFTYVAYGTNVLDAMGYSAFYSRIGIAGTTKFSLFGSFENAFLSFKESALSIYKTLYLLFSSKQIGVGDLSGFIGIYTMTANAASQGFYTLLSWVGLLSVNLGIVNLLPIPALDGGRLVFIGYEAITKKKPNQKFENLLHTIVFFLLIALLIFVTYNDILRLFGLD